MGDAGIGESLEGLLGVREVPMSFRRRPAFTLMDCLSSRWQSRKGADGSFIRHRVINRGPKALSDPPERTGAGLMQHSL